MLFVVSKLVRSYAKCKWLAQQVSKRKDLARMRRVLSDLHALVRCGILDLPKPPRSVLGSYISPSDNTPFHQSSNKTKLRLSTSTDLELVNKMENMLHALSKP